MTKKQQAILSAISEPFALVPSPFAHPAQRLGVSEADFLSILRKHRKSGVIRRIGVVLNHREAGLKSNALVLWTVPSSRLNGVGKIFARFHAVSHCYARRPCRHWPYNLYTMVHGKNLRETSSIIDTMMKASNIREYRVFPTLKEFKRARADIQGVLGNKGTHARKAR